MLAPCVITVWAYLNESGHSTIFTFVTCPAVDLAHRVLYLAGFKRLLAKTGTGNYVGPQLL